MTPNNKNEKTCVHCKKNRVESDSLFTRLCKNCTGQNELIEQTRKSVASEIFKEIEKTLYHFFETNLILKTEFEELKRKFE